jgi:chromosome partitioning protein
MAKIITIAQKKGGSGKSTIAVQLAVALSKKSNKVALLDIDKQKSTSQWFSERQKAFGKDFEGISCKDISGWRISSEISNIGEHTDYIIIDSPPTLETETRSAIRSSDLIIVPMQASPTDLWATNEILECCREANKLTKILFNRYNNTKIAREISSQIEEGNCMKSTLGSRAIFSSSMLSGKGVLEVAPKSTAASELKQVVSEIESLI